jgi:hypothetical protein
MAAEFLPLVYRGDLTGEEHAQPGCLLGWDEFGRPYEIFSADYADGRTVILLRYATPEHISEQQAELKAAAMRVQRLDMQAQLRHRMAAAGPRP